MKLSDFFTYLLLITGFLILLLFWQGGQQINFYKTIIFIDHQTFENYYKKQQQNPSCPGLNESEWEIFKDLTTPNIPVVSVEDRQKLTWKDMGLVSFTSKTHMKEAIANCASIRTHPQLQSLPFTMFFSNDINETHSQQYQKECPQAKCLPFPFEDFPDYVKRLDHYRFKAIHQAMAFKNHKILLSFDSSILFNKNANFSELIESSIKENPTDVSLLTPAKHNMFSTVHPKMYDCFPGVKPESMLTIPQFQSGLMLWIGSEMGWKAMSRFVECSLQSNCIAPPGATIKCNIQRIYKNQKVFSGCHRFDQAAINLILYETSNHKPELYQRKSQWFKVSRKP